MSKLLNTKRAISKINGLIPKSAESYFEIGTILKSIKDKIDTFDTKKDKAQAKMEYLSMIDDDLPFGEVVARKLVAIASSESIKVNLDIIPSAYNTMYSMKDFDIDDFNKLREAGLNSFTTSKELSAMKVELFNKNDFTGEEDFDASTLLNKKKKKDFSDIKVDIDNSEDNKFIDVQYLNIDIDVSKLTPFEKKKVKDLLSKIEKLKFSSEKGVSVNNNINPDILSDAPLSQVA